jgi:aminoglycoside phosphotransferase (APT) family kinase protein
MDIEDRAELTAWLRASGHIEASEDPAIRVLAGGVSNRTVRVERANGEAWVLKQALPKLRVAVEWECSPERIEREVLGCECLGKLLPPGAVPRLLFQSRADHLFAMTAVPEPHENWKTMLLEGRVDTGHVRQFAELLAAIHSAPAKRLPELLRDRSFFESLRLAPYYRYTAEQVPEAAGFYRALIEDTLAQQSALVHGDFSPKNILVHGGRLVLIDHEVVHIGDPAFDLGFALTHLLSKAHHVAARRGQFVDAVREFWRVYGGDARVEARAVRHTLGCLLARVAGKSKLEYLDREAQRRQRAAVVKLMEDPPASVAELALEFIRGIERWQLSTA